MSPDRHAGEAGEFVLDLSEEVNIEVVLFADILDNLFDAIDSFSSDTFEAGLGIELFEIVGLALSFGETSAVD